MADDETDTGDGSLQCGPGVTDWLASTVGAPRASKAVAKPEMPTEFRNIGVVRRRVDLELPHEVVVADGGAFQYLEIRGLPKGVELTEGRSMVEGYWLVEPEHLYGLAAMVPASVALPFSVMLKGVFCGDDPDTPWSELTGYEFTETAPDADTDDTPPVHMNEAGPEPDTTPVSAAEPASSAPRPEPGPAESMVVVDLDVSVGTDDPDTLKDIVVRFSGLPYGAKLSTGDNKDGNWSVAATDLSELSIIIPVGTADFELDVEMEIAGSAPQSASIHVETSSVDPDPEAAFTVRLAPVSRIATPRISIFTDGTAIYDRILNWSAMTGPYIELLVPYVDNALPFEIVIRHDAAGDDAPRLLGLDIDGVSIAADSASISALGSYDGAGVAWQGDLVVDVRHALKPPAPEPPRMPDNGTLAHQPAETTEPSASVEPETQAAAIAEVDAVLPPEPSPMPSDADEPEVDFAAPIDDEFENSEIVEPPVSTMDDAHSEKDVRQADEVSEVYDEDGNEDVLVVDASYSDLQRPSFLKELRNLRDFIRTRPSDDSGEIYDRLGIDVTKWHDMAVRGPVGAPVDLDPRFPGLAPRGGIDNTRDFRALHISDTPDNADVVLHITNVPPGALLTRGKNLGHGVWSLNAWETEQLAILPPVAHISSIVLQVGWRSSTEEEGKSSPRQSLYVAQKHQGMRLRGTEMCAATLPVDPEIFDPDGHGALSLTLGEMPPGAVLSSGRNHGGGVWTLEMDVGKDVSLNVAAATRPFTVTLTCVALNTTTGKSTVVSRILDVAPMQSKISLRTGMAA